MSEIPARPDQVSPDRVLAWLRLGRVPMIGPVLIKRLVTALGSPEAVLGAHATRLAAVEGIGPQRAEAFARSVGETLADAQRELTEADQRGIQVLCAEHPNWPPGLKTIPDPPIVLYVRGQIKREDVLAIGVVGSRNCTLYGREQAARFGALLAGAGVTVISGGARGIDSSAHEGALRGKGRTIVVQGCGLLHCYPEENTGLYARIEQEDAGAVISELPLDSPPVAEHFPPRNRIIAGMSLGVLVVEANQRSGSLITARLAADDYGREVFAIPGRIDSPASAGTHHLIKAGAAHLVESLADILDALGDAGRSLTKDQDTATLHERAAPAKANKSGDGLFAHEAAVNGGEPTLPFTAVQQKILAAMADDTGRGVTADDVCDRSALPAAVVMAELTMLQIRGAVVRAGANRFALRQQT